jgi:hypothetical protein
LLNQFSVDEHDGYLRVVTQPDWSGTGHSVVVLEQAGRELRTVGRITGISPDEVLYSVRFVGECAFLVTFRRVDPLFVVDLSDPAQPELLGELHIPGYSDYLQPIDENHLLAIGRGADEATGLFQELQVSIFDVSNLADPQLVHRYSFGGGRSTATPATGDRWTLGDGDHHAVSYFPSEQILAMPIYSADGAVWWGNAADDSPLFEPGKGGLQVFRIDVDGGFRPLGIIEHDTLVERSVQIGDRLFAISSGTVSVHELNNPAAELGRIDLGPVSGAELVRLAMYQPLSEESTTETFPFGNSPMASVEYGRLSALDDRPHAATSRTAALVTLPTMAKLDAQLLHVLACDATSRDLSPDASPPDSIEAGEDLLGEVTVDSLTLPLDDFGLSL